MGNGSWSVNEKCSRGRRLRGLLHSVNESLPSGAALRVAHKVVDKLRAGAPPQRLPLGHTTRCRPHRHQGHRYTVPLMLLAHQGRVCAVHIWPAAAYPSKYELEGGGAEWRRLICTHSNAPLRLEVWVNPCMHTLIWQHQEVCQKQDWPQMSEVRLLTWWQDAAHATA